MRIILFLLTLFITVNIWAKEETSFDGNIFFDRDEFPKIVESFDAFLNGFSIDSDRDLSGTKRFLQLDSIISSSSKKWSLAINRKIYNQSNIEKIGLKVLDIQDKQVKFHYKTNNTVFIKPSPRVSKDSDGVIFTLKPGEGVDLNDFNIYYISKIKKIIKDSENGNVAAN